MANTAGSSMIIKHYDGFGGNFIDSQYLGASYDGVGKPHVFQDTLMRIFSSQNRFITNGGKLLIGMTGAKGPINTMEIDTEIYRWYLQGADYRTARVIENPESSNTVLGINNTVFRLKLDLDYYAEPDVLLAENNNYALEVIGDPIQEGNGYVYSFRLQGDDMSQYLPSYLVDPGRELSKGWTSVQSEYNEKFGTQQYPSSMQLEHQISYFAEKQTVTDKAWRNQGRLGVKFLYKDPMSGADKSVEKFLPYAEAVMQDQFHMDMEVQMMFGKKQTRAGHKGYWKKTGNGVREQLKDSWIDIYSSALTVTRLKDYLLNIFFARVNEGDRKMVAMTGTYGSLQFHNMLASVASSFLTVDTMFTQMLSKDPRHLSFGAQFTHYQGPEGIEVTLVKNPMYDNRQYCKQTHPQYSNIPVDSFRYTFLDFGGAGTSEKGGAINNIMMLKEKDSYAWGYVHGTHTPTGPVKGGVAGGLIAGYDIFMQGSAGVWIKDVTRCGELIFDSQS